MTLPDALTIERAGLKAWPGIEVEWDGSWVRRAANGYTKRANSVQCFDPADDNDIERRVADACRWFEARALPPVFRVNLLTGPALAGHLDTLSWQAVAHSRLLAMPLGAVEPDPRGEVLAIRDPTFLEVQRTLKNLDKATLGKLESLLAVMQVPACGLVVRSDDGRPVASALMAVADGIVITGNVVTDAAERRKGYAAATMRTGLSWARETGASVAALNVEADNPAAIALYESLGFRRRYDYAYRIPASS